MRILIQRVTEASKLLLMKKKKQNRKRIISFVGIRS